MARYVTPETESGINKASPIDFAPALSVPADIGLTYKMNYTRGIS